MPKNINTTEKIFILISPIIILIVLGLNFYKEASQQIEQNSLLFPAIMFVISILYAGIVVVKSPSIKEYNTKPYIPMLYAQLQSEKAVYPFVGAVFSLGSIWSTNLSSGIDVSMWMIGVYFLSLSTISYRHLTYAIYMQEVKRKLCEISFECMQK